MRAQGVVYYDGLCRLCSAEIGHYQKQKGSDVFEFVDITQPNFDASAHGLDPYKVHKVMHVRDFDGNLQEGVEAFRVIWSGIPRYHFMLKLSDNRFVRALMEAGYQGFVKVRPYLPRKKAGCETSPYCEVKK